MAKKKRAEPWRVHFFRRHRDDDPTERSPGDDFLESCPVKVRATFRAILFAVADAPPPAFSGGGKWEAMHGSMNGYYEARVDGPQRRHYRLFCVLERNGADVGLGGPSIVAITGMSKPFLTTFTEAEYGQVRVLGSEYARRSPRSVLS
jgi:Txe/YoeB family toxin of Txe-Axe toxin-antitoxin module